MGAFDDLVPGGTSQGGNFDEFISTTKIPKSENILQKAVKSIQGAYTNPATAGMSQSNPAMAGYNILHNFKSSLVEDVMPNNPTGQFMANMATDPETYVGMGEAGKAVGSAGKFILNPSAGYGKALETAGNVDFHAPIMNALDDPLAAKVIDKSGIMDKYGGIHLGEGGASSPRLSNLTLKESQDIINKLKGGVSKAVVEGDHLAPKHIPVTNLFNNLSDAQNAIPGMEGAKKMYGIAKEVPDVVGKIAKRALLGSELGGGYEAGKGLIKKVFGL